MALNNDDFPAFGNPTCVERDVNGNGSKFVQHKQGTGKAAFPYQASVGHRPELQLKIPLLSWCPWCCCHRGTVLIRQEKSVTLTTQPAKRSHVLLSMLRKIYYCLSMLLHHGADWYLQVRETSGLPGKLGCN